MTSVEFSNKTQFNDLKQKLSSDLGRELTDTEIQDYILEFGFTNYEKLVNTLKMKIDDKSPTQDQIDKMAEYIITDIDDTDLSEKIDEILYET